ncbi:MAG: hypothetical protein KatS3mg087_0484 [Patescibacteria group bacterium]|nr:MAG: hypothetical protein KatS3mg087_0484 [Patescibacteria group bacterium]
MRTEHISLDCIIQDGIVRVDYFGGVDYAYYIHRTSSLHLLVYMQPLERTDFRLGRDDDPPVSFEPRVSDGIVDYNLRIVDPRTGKIMSKSYNNVDAFQFGFDYEYPDLGYRKRGHIISFNPSMCLYVSRMYHDGLRLSLVERFYSKGFEPFIGITGLLDLYDSTGINSLGELGSDIPIDVEVNIDDYRYTLDEGFGIYSVEKAGHDPAYYDEFEDY